MPTETQSTEPELTLHEAADGTVAVAGLKDDPLAAGTLAPEDDERRPAHTASEEDTAAEEAELAAAATDADREAIRARRRAERADRKNRRREVLDNFAQENATLRSVVGQMAQRLRALEQRGVGSDLAALDNEIERTAQYTRELKEVIAEATKAQNGEVVADATDRLTRANSRTAQLQAVRADFIQRANAARAPSAAPPMDPAVRANGAAWRTANAWFNPEAGDADTRQAQALDDFVAARGFDPRTPEYWAELDKLVAEHLPHRARTAPARTEPNPGYNGAAERKPGAPNPVAGSGREAVAGGSAGSSAPRTGFVLSRERVEALKQSGLWDDPKARAEAIRRYRQHDRDAAGAART